MLQALLHFSRPSHPDRPPLPNPKTALTNKPHNKPTSRRPSTHPEKVPKRRLAVLPRTSPKKYTATPRTRMQNMASPNSYSIVPYVLAYHNRQYLIFFRCSTQIMHLQDHKKHEINHEQLVFGTLNPYRLSRWEAVEGIKCVGHEE
ncbi:hypothetical protein M758_2G115300 [Ceratodon purpureus]|nr:hypothetical protein M758_2G115300 [Ceratodon purpureus]